jgi:hypothetical protein
MSDCVRDFEPDEFGGAAMADDPMVRTRRYLASLGLPERDLGSLPDSGLRFPDGGQFRIEIPSVEGPAALRAVIEAGREHGIRIHRISQGSGIMLQTDAEIAEMVELGAAHDVEVCLFVGPRASWDVGIQARSVSGAVAAGALRGADQLVYGIEDVVRAVGLGLRSVLVADVGQLWVLGRMKRSGDLPADLVLKSSVSLPAANPATARLLEDLGVTTVNLPVDLTAAQVAAIRVAVDVPLDIYVEAADDFGGTVRYYEIPDLVRVAAPVHLKFTVRNAPGIYPSGRHLEGVALTTARERVRRAAIGVAILKRYYGEAVESTSSAQGPSSPA